MKQKHSHYRACSAHHRLSKLLLNSQTSRKPASKRTFFRTLLDSAVRYVRADIISAYVPSPIPTTYKAWKKGTSGPFVAYALDECTLRIHNPDARTRDISNKAGASTGIVTGSHITENIRPADCHPVFVEYN